MGGTRGAGEEERRAVAVGPADGISFLVFLSASFHLPARKSTSRIFYFCRFAEPITDSPLVFVILNITLPHQSHFVSAGIAGTSQPIILLGGKNIAFFIFGKDTGHE